MNSIILYRDSNGNALARVEGENGVDYLPTYLDEVNHSPTGFEWGYFGSGPAQLSYAILRYVLQDEERAKANYLMYKEAVIGHLPRQRLEQGDLYRIDFNHVIDVVEVMERVRNQKSAKQ